MKKLLPFLLILGACTKSDNDKPYTSSWETDGITHTADTTYKNLGSLYAKENSDNQVLLSFTDFPAQNSFDTVAGNQSGAHRVFLQVKNNGDLYSSKDTLLLISTFFEGAQMLVNVPLMRLYNSQQQALQFSGVITLKL